MIFSPSPVRGGKYGNSFQAFAENSEGFTFACSRKEIPVKFAFKVIKQRLSEIWKQTQGARYDVIAGRVAGVIGGIAVFAALIAPYVRFIPGRTGEIVAGGCAVIAAVSPRASKAAGLLRLAYGQKLALFPALKLMLQTLLAGPSLVAEAKAAEASEAQKQKDAEGELRVAQQVKDELARLGITQGLNRTDLSLDVPVDLKAALQAAPKQEQTIKQSPTLTASVTIEDKLPRLEDKAPSTTEGATKDLFEGNTL